jgi:hypothetical protein
MASSSLILGTIRGIPKRHYKTLEEELKASFENVGWKDNTLYIRSEKKHSRVRWIFQKIADAMQEGKFGSLLYVGNNRVACIYFGHKRFVGRQYREPNPPEWWGVKK